MQQELFNITLCSLDIDNMRQQWGQNVTTLPLTGDDSELQEVRKKMGDMLYFIFWPFLKILQTNNETMDDCAPPVSLSGSPNTRRQAAMHTIHTYIHALLLLLCFVF